MAGRVEQDAHVVLRLEVGHRRAELDRVGDGRGQVVDRDVDVQHHLLLPVRGWPHAAAT